MRVVTRDAQLERIVNDKVRLVPEQDDAPVRRERRSENRGNLGWKVVSLISIGCFLCCLVAQALPLAYCFGIVAALASAAQ